MDQPISPRLRGLTTIDVLGREVPVADSFRSRLLGLALLDWSEAGAGLLIPRCASIHTFGMRFPLDLFFLDSRNGLVACRLGVPPCRFVSHRGAVAVLEAPARTGRTVQ